MAILSASTLRELKQRWELEDLCGHQLAKIGRLEARIQHLEEQLRRNSSNSSQPPSMDGPNVARATAKPPRRWRRSGGRLGHLGRTRVLAPMDRVDAVVDCRPACCAACDQPLAGTDP